MIVSNDTIIIYMSYIPPHKITNKILDLAQNVTRELGFLAGAKLKSSPITLRKKNKIKTIHASLAIEGNSLSIDQITAILEGKRIIAPQKDIVEVTNAIKLYDILNEFDPLVINDLLKAHQLLMNTLISDNGKWRAGGVGIMAGSKVTHIAPSAKRVSFLMNELFNFLKNTKNISWLIKACIFHYELEFIHPFSDGNGRMGRLWQQLILMKEDEIFEYIPIEILIKNNQQEYYNILSACDNAGESTLFIEFMLQQILSSLKFYSQNIVSNINNLESRLNYAKENFKETLFTRKDYILLHKNISTSTASRDLKDGITQQLLIKTGENNRTLYQFV